MKTLKTMVVVAKVALVKLAYQWDTFAACWAKLGRDQLEARRVARENYEFCMAELEEEALKL